MGSLYDQLYGELDVPESPRTGDIWVAGGVYYHVVRATQCLVEIARIPLNLNLSNPVHQRTTFLMETTAFESMSTLWSRVHG